MSDAVAHVPRISNTPPPINDDDDCLNNQSQDEDCFEPPPVCVNANEDRLTCEEILDDIKLKLEIADLSLADRSVDELVVHNDAEQEASTVEPFNAANKEAVTSVEFSNDSVEAVEPETDLFRMANTEEPSFIQTNWTTQEENSQFDTNWNAFDGTGVLINDEQFPETSDWANFGTTTATEAIATDDLFNTNFKANANENGEAEKSWLEFESTTNETQTQPAIAIEIEEPKKEADSQPATVDNGGDDDWDDFVSNDQEESTRPEQQVPDQPPDDLSNHFDINSYDIIFDEICDRLDVNLDDYLTEADGSIGTNEPFVNISIEKLWTKFVDVDNCELLEYQFKNSIIQQIYFDAMCIDRTPEGKLKNQRNYAILFTDDEDDEGRDTKPKKTQSRKKSQSSSHKAEITTQVAPQATISTFDFDLSYLEKQEERKQPVATNSGNNVSSLLNDLLEDIYPTATIEKSDSNILISSLATTAGLSKNALDLIEKLPNLSFMKSNILAIPLQPETQLSDTTPNEAFDLI